VQASFTEEISKTGYDELLINKLQKSNVVLDEIELIFRIPLFVKREASEAIERSSSASADTSFFSLFYNISTVSVPILIGCFFFGLWLLSAIV